MTYTDATTLYQYRLWQLLLLLCNALEFSELPVRHNEEYLNDELADAIVARLNQEHLDLPDTNPSHNPRGQQVSSRQAPTQVLSLTDFLMSNNCNYLSPHVKAFLLLVAHMKHVPLPIADYVNDTKTVLDQVKIILSTYILNILR